MSARKIKSRDYESLASRPDKNGSGRGDQSALKSLESVRNEKSVSLEVRHAQGLKNSNRVSETRAAKVSGDVKVSESAEPAAVAQTENPAPVAYSEQQKIRKKEKLAEKDSRLIDADRWIGRNGHALTYAGLYIFSILVLFRPYELVPGLGFLSSTAFYFAALTLLIFIPTQLSTEGSMTAFPTEVKCVLVMILLAVVTIPIGKDAGNSWLVFKDTYIKSVLMFIVMVNVLRTRARLMGLLWLSLAVGVVLSYMAIGMYARGELKAEGYRVAVQIGGMFGNPNDLALHLVTMMPIAVGLALAAKSRLMRLLYFAMAGVFIAGNMVTFSRGGFLGLIVTGAVLAWKLGRRQRLNVVLASGVAGGLVILLAPGNYGLRILSILYPALDPVGSNDQRRELLFRSIWVTLRNPWGIGVGNSPVMNDFNLQTHNAYTQVSSELGILGFAAYIIFIVSPFRKLAAIERTLIAEDRRDWFYYLSIGLQASIAGYMVSSFFVSVAYNWFIYYLIAYAVAFRRIYRLENESKTNEAKQRAFSGEMQTAQI
ncbi:MAG TPA: O-antigen ligase family protein [Pyrinomonadaceae bacterium]